MNIYYQIIIIQEKSYLHGNKIKTICLGKLAGARIMKCHRLKVTVKLSINYFLIIDLYLKCVGSNIIGKQGYILKFVLME